MLGTGEPCAKKAKYDLQRKYNERRKEKPRKPQFSLNFQFNFGEEGEMRETNERFVRLRNMANLRAGRSNADFLQALVDRYEGKNQDVNPPEMNSVAIQANSTESVFELFAQRRRKSILVVSGHVGKQHPVHSFCLLRELMNASLYVGRIA